MLYSFSDMASVQNDIRCVVWNQRCRVAMQFAFMQITTMMQTSLREQS